MKFTPIPMIMTGMLMSSIANAQTLEEKWNLEEPAFNYTNKVFELTYKFSDFIASDPQTEATLYFYKSEDADGPLNCKSETLDNVYPGSALSVLASSIETGDTGEGTYTTAQKEIVKVQLDTAIIADDTDVFTDGQGTAAVKFCLRYSLCTGECGAANSYEVNFLESLVTLTVDLRGEFEVTGIQVEPKDKIKRTANQEYGLEAFQCLGKNVNGGIKYDETTTPTTPPTFTQGDVITICVQPDSTARGDNIYMRKVERFEYVLLAAGSTDETDTKQLAIDITQIPSEGGTATAKGEMYGLTEIDNCLGERACVIKTILFATFYTRPGTVTGAGTATMQFGDDGNDGVFSARKLRGAEQEERALQADDVAGAGEFDVNFQIESNDTFQSASGASSSMTVLALLGSAAAALAL